MLKKIILATIMIGLIVVLIAGAINRTLAKTEVVEGRGNGAENYTEENALGAEGVYYRGRNQQNLPGEEVILETETQGQGRGRGSAQGEGGNQLDNNPRGSQSSALTGEAEMKDWIPVEGVVTGVDAEILTLTTSENTVIEVEGRAWRYAQEQKFMVQVGDQVALTGFYEGEDLEIGQLTNLSTASGVLLRDVSGRPNWAGRWQGGK
jgi:hypothetical protein